VSAALHLPSGDHEGLEGFRVLDASGSTLGSVAAVERLEAKLFVVIECLDSSFRAISWGEIQVVDLDRHAVTLSDHGARSLTRAPAIGVERLLADDDSLVRYLPSSGPRFVPAPGGSVDTRTGPLVAAVGLLGIGMIALLGVVLFLDGNSVAPADWAWFAVPLAFFAAAGFALVRIARPQE
jgi:hypothetical protein